MLEIAARLVLAGVLVAASIAKLADRRTSQAAMATFGFVGPTARKLAWAGVISAELVLAVALAAGSDSAAYVAAGMMAVFALTLVSAILRGQAGAPCACFGARSRVSWLSVIRNAGLAVAFAAVPALPGGTPTTDEWLAFGLIVALCACVALAVAVLALGRELGMLRLRLGPESALEVPDEGPAIGARSALASRFALSGEQTLALAVFSSAGCHICRTLEPAIESIAAEPIVSVSRIDEESEPEVWERERIPGSPFAVALDRAGTVLAKGTFNNLAQLESVLATAERRAAAGGVLPGAVGPGTLV